MSELSVVNNAIVWNIQKGTSNQAVVNKADGWAMYEVIRMDFKNIKQLNAPVVLSLVVGGGLTIDTNRLIIDLTYDQTALFANPRMYADIKFQIADQVLEPIPFTIHLTETVTKL